MKRFNLSLLILMILAGCKIGSGVDVETASGSNLSSIVIGDVASITNALQVLTIKTSSGTNTYRGKEKFKDLKFAPGQKVTLSLIVYSDKDGKNVAAQTVDKAGSKCPSKEVTLKAGSNVAKISLCLPEKPGTTVQNPNNANTTTTAGSEANVDIKPCIVGVDKDCLDSDVVVAGVPELDAVKGTMPKILENGSEPAKFTIALTNSGKHELICAIKLDVGDNFNLSSDQTLSIKPGANESVYTFNQGTESAFSMKDLMDIAEQRNGSPNDKNKVVIQLFNCRVTAGTQITANLAAREHTAIKMDFVDARKVLVKE